jgi:hypothetical protein
LLFVEEHLGFEVEQEQQVTLEARLKTRHPALRSRAGTLGRGDKTGEAAVVFGNPSNGHVVVADPKQTAPDSAIDKEHPRDAIQLHRLW